MQTASSKPAMIRIGNQPPPNVSDNKAVVATIEYAPRK
jgi:hypothetical protein